MDPDDLQALEYVGHQRVRLKDLDGALAEFEKLKNVAQNKSDPLTQSRALKFMAQIKDTTGSPTDLQDAKRLVREAIDLLSEAEKGSLEEAELHEISGNIRIKTDNLPSAKSAFTDAERIYHANPTLLEAAEGLNRVRTKMTKIRLELEPGRSEPPSNRISETNQQA